MNVFKHVRDTIAHGMSNAWKKATSSKNKGIRRIKEALLTVPLILTAGALAFSVMTPSFADNADTANDANTVLNGVGTVHMNPEEIWEWYKPEFGGTQSWAHGLPPRTPSLPIEAATYIAKRDLPFISGKCKVEFKRLDNGDASEAGTGTAVFDVTFGGYHAECRCINPDRPIPIDGEYPFIAWADYESGDNCMGVYIMSGMTALHAQPGTLMFPEKNDHPPYQNIGWAKFVTCPDLRGWLDVTKYSSNLEISGNNMLYQLGDTEYGIYKDKECTKLKKTVKLDKTGHAVVKDLQFGRYYMKETKAPKGFALDPKVTPVGIIMTKTQYITLDETPQRDPVDLLVKKRDADTGRRVPEGNATLEGAEYTFKFYKSDSASGTPDRTWVLRTDERGHTGLRQAKEDPTNYFISGDPFYLNEHNVPVLPLGTLTVQETKAPKGYNINPEVFTRHITPEDNGRIDIHTFNTPECPDRVQRGQLRIEKLDRDLMEGYAQGDSTLAGIKYEIINKSK